jgi:uncharacterized membrane protein
MTRKILSIIIGYLVFAVTALALFEFAGQNAHSNPTNIFAFFAAIYGAFFSFLAGLVSQYVAKTSNLKINYVLAFMIAAFATFSLLKTVGNHWTQLLAIFIFAPVSILGGLFYKTKKDSKKILTKTN